MERTQLDLFREALEANDIKPPKNIIVDGHIHRCDTNSSNGECDASYLLFEVEGYLTGFLNNWQHSDEIVIFRPDESNMSPFNAEQLREKMDEVRAIADDERREREVISRKKLRDFYEKCSGNIPAEHPYCKKKKIAGYPGIKVGTWAFKKGSSVPNALIIPIHDIKGTILSCQAIYPDGGKAQFPGLSYDKTGFFMLGSPTLSKVIAITESYSNGYSLHKALNIPVAVSFGAKRLAKVARILESGFPDHRILIAADNDYAKYNAKGELQVNEGLRQANKVLEIMPGAAIVMPPEEADKEATDWNSHAQDHGYNSIREYFSEYLESEGKRLFYYRQLEMTPPNWIVKGLLESDSLACLVGPSGVGKSFVVLDLIASLVSGRNFLDEYQVKKGPVVYIAGEGFNGAKRRIAAWELANPEQILGDLIISNKAYHFLDEGEILAFCEELQLYIDDLGHTPALVVIDTLARNFGEGDENSTQDMNRFIKAMDAIKEKFACCVLLVHHTGHDKTRGRGNSALYAAVDTEYILSKTEDSGVVVLKATKTKDGSKPSDISIAFEDVPIPGYTDNFGQEFSSSVVRLANSLDKYSYVFQSPYKEIIEAVVAGDQWLLKPTTKEFSRLQDDELIILDQQGNYTPNPAKDQSIYIQIKI